MENLNEYQQFYFIDYITNHLSRIFLIRYVHQKLWVNDGNR